MVLASVFAALGLLLGLAATYQPQGGQLHRIATSVGDEIDSLIHALKESSTEPGLRSLESLSLISTAQMGIPMDEDLEKRAVAQGLLAHNGDFASIFFLTPDGDVYMGEPFEQQKELPRLNYSDRDWYEGAVRTRDAYVSSVFMSAAINRPAIAIVVPVYTQEGSSTLSGYLVAIVKLEEIENNLRQSALSGNSRILLVDHSGIHVADTSRDPTMEPTELRSYSGLESVNHALSGKSGQLREMIDGQVVDVHYGPVGVYPNTWAIISIG